MKSRMTSKIFKKQKRFFERLYQEKGIKCSSAPTATLVICNIGQATGLCNNVLQNSLKNELPHLEPVCILIRGESYCYLKFKSIAESTEVVDKLNGTFKVSSDGPVAYFNYVDEEPKTVIECDSQNPDGLTILENFISDEEEAILVNIFDVLNTNTLKNRQVAHFGYEFKYGSNDVNLDEPLDAKIPSECDFIWERLKEGGRIFQRPPDQLTINKYLPGQGISSHVDKHSPFGPSLVVLSLLGDVVMDWRHYNGQNVPLLIPQRSLYIMEGEARYDWKHGIQSRTWDPHIEIVKDSSGKEIRLISDVHKERTTRISLTFRWTRRGDCECDFPALCDSQSKKRDELIDQSTAVKLEELHVHKVYDKIAPHFSTTRHKPWPKVQEYVTGLPSGTVLLDLGSGNGKNITSRTDILQIALERSEGLLAECKFHTSRLGNASDCFQGDMLHAPLRDGCADSVICIAVIHHFSNKERRIESIRSISRLLRPGGTAFITVWARDQTKANYLAKESEDTTCKTHQTAGINLPVHENRTQFQHNDLLVPWKLRSGKKLEEVGDTLLRYYHVFEEGELVELCKEVQDLEVLECFYEQGNWCVVVRRI